MHVQPYHREQDFSYALGAFPSYELLKARPECARALLLSENAWQSAGMLKLVDECAKHNVPLRIAGRGGLQRISKKENCYAAVMFEKYPCELTPDRPHIALHNISDNGNLGTILRTCLGFGVRDVAIIRPAVDPFDPRVLRASMGAAFHMNIVEYEGFDKYQQAFPGQTIYPFLLSGATELRVAAAEKRSPWTLVFGNESGGLPEEFVKIGQGVVIPHAEAIDSLNLAVAAGIGVHAFTEENIFL